MIDPQLSIQPDPHHHLTGQRGGNTVAVAALSVLTTVFTIECLHARSLQGLVCRIVRTYWRTTYVSS